MLCVSDMHLCKSDRIARRSGVMLPPYDSRDTLAKLARDIATTDPKTVLCLGDSFDDLTAAESLTDIETESLTRFQAGRNWLWLEGNHDPGPLTLGGTHLAEYQSGGLTFRHIASRAGAEISGHYHPKHTIPGTGQARPCFLTDGNRLIMPAYGTYTGGLRATDAVLADQFSRQLVAILTGHRAICVPVHLPAVKQSNRSARPARLRGNML